MLPVISNSGITVIRIKTEAKVFQYYTADIINTGLNEKNILPWTPLGPLKDIFFT